MTDGASTTIYAYNGDGDRVSQTVDGVTTTYLLDVATPLTMVLAEQTGTETITYLHGLDLVAQSDGVTTGYFAYDGLGSVRQVVDATGTPLLTQTFDPYGSLYARTGKGVTTFGFTGEYGDGATPAPCRAAHLKVWENRTKAIRLIRVIGSVTAAPAPLEDTHHWESGLRQRRSFTRIAPAQLTRSGSWPPSSRRPATALPPR